MQLRDARELVQHRADARRRAHVEEAERRVRREAGEVRLHERPREQVGAA